ncbi:NAD(P)/FAD-dependent oxidoreductase [Adlercreutzia murintestinalis]|uniref:NAD(P)/FAD-dependent oxidoreductase n=1 Tax=Adlercreutzia murintestinalis TaxID=2941325 RepID=UPI00203E5638|nr:NAD(P)/FAD-dependent oxidoreductase [Adlercreutzia murintestinalis]
MQRDYPNLCKPITLGKLTLRNRMASAPMGATDILADGTPGPRTLGFYEARAKGGAASVTVSELVVHPATDGSQMLHLSLATPGQLGAFAYVADAIKRHGAVASIELSHSGQYAGTYMVDKEKKGSLCQWGPSDGVRPDGMPVRALSVEQIADIVAAYAEAAALAKRAGFQMCMVHAGHGWLLNQFLSPYFNKREDEYGGSLENRVRIVREVLSAVREATGPGFPIELRMSGSELFDGGYDVEEGCRIAQALQDQIDLLHVSAGSYQFGFSLTHPSMFRDHGVNVHLAARIKQCVDVPVATIGGLSDPAQMEEIIASGKADMVAMARGLLADPELPNKVMANRGADVVKCVRCFVCMAERPITQTRRCAVNPLIGREFEGLEIVPAGSRKRVLVVGGGIAGLKAAHTAALRGHDVTLCEASGALGGILNTEAALPFKYDMYELARTYARLIEHAGVHIILNQPVDAAFCETFKPDALIVAVGSEELELPMPADADAWVIGIDELYLENADPGDEVVIIGGGLTGCECALLMAQQGRTVHVVEMGPELAPDANIRNRPILLAELENTDIEVLTGARAEAIQADGVMVALSDGTTRVVPGTSVISAIGRRSRSAVVEGLRDGAPFVRVVGDALRPANICLAIYEAYHAALDI